MYRLKATGDFHGHQQAGARYAVVLQSDDLPLST
jgi:mRNA interferase MazF